MVLFTIPFTSAEVIVELSTDNLTWKNVTNIEVTNGFATPVELEEGTRYFFRAKNSTTDFKYFVQTTKTSGEKSMSSLSVTLFFLAITSLLIGLPMLIKEFTGNWFLDSTLRGLSIVLGLFLLSLTTSVLVTLSNTFNLGVTSSLFTMLFLINWTIYIAMGLVVLTFGWRILSVYSQRKQDRRFGIKDGEE